MRTGEISDADVSELNLSDEDFGETAPENDEEPSNPIYYFSYGLMVNPVARHSRGVVTENCRAVLLPDHRLNFRFGGCANIEKATGWEAYGVLMTCCTKEDWNKIAAFESGFLCIEVDVFVLKQGEDVEDLPDEEDGFVQVHETPIRARTFVLPESKKSSMPRKIPQERVLRVIATGLQAYNVSEDYINDEIMGTEFIPNKKPEDYEVFPLSECIKKDQAPTLTLEKWNKEYEKRMKKAEKKNIDTLLFRIGEDVMQVENCDLKHPFLGFVNDRIGGPQDSTWVVIQTFYDPDIPMICSEDEITPLHYAWAMNQSCSMFATASCKASRIYRVQLPEKKKKQKSHTSQGTDNTADSCEDSSGNIATSRSGNSKKVPRRSSRLSISGTKESWAQFMDTVAKKNGNE
mmetsp:Transcript_11354/g.17406  ORF Transcript_11354/g.17406 Transcript_11354/m.17406 type:complete len:404 (+) Transcript_11354:137-1348(+)